MSDWHLAPSLVEFNRWIAANYPKHNRSEDGTIGDKAHEDAWRLHGIWSDHLPNARRSVNAVDTKETNVHMPTLLVVAMMHPSTTYVIYERVIYKRRKQWRGEAYTGSNTHDTHGHTSIDQTVKAEQSKTPWGLTTWPTLINGAVGGAVSQLQGFLNVYGDLSQQLMVDGHFGDKTEARVRDYQRDYHVVGGDDGIVGVHTRYHLLTNPHHRH